jgi:hypothetical protein
MLGHAVIVKMAKVAMITHLETLMDSGAARTHRFNLLNRMLQRQTSLFVNIVAFRRTDCWQ